MQYSKTSVILSLLPVTLAQYGYGDSSKASTTVEAAAASTAASSSGPIHTVKVGDGGLTFDPDTLTAAVGDTVTSFFSGGIKTASGENEETFSITVTDSKPIWYYCGFPGHCGAGMAGVINPP